MEDKKDKKNFRLLGASNHSNYERDENDYYATDPKMGGVIADIEDISNEKVVDNSYGQGALMEYFHNNNYPVLGFDILQRQGVESSENFVFLKKDFLSLTKEEFEMYCKKLNPDTDKVHFVFNPPYKLAQEFIEKSIELMPNGSKCCAFLRLQFLEGQKRRSFFRQYPFKNIHVSSSRVVCALNGDFEGFSKKGGTTIAYAWFVWEKDENGKLIDNLKVNWFN